MSLLLCQVLLSLVAVAAAAAAAACFPRLMWWLVSGHLEIFPSPDPWGEVRRLVNAGCMCQSPLKKYPFAPYLHILLYIGSLLPPFIPTPLNERAGRVSERRTGFLCLLLIILFILKRHIGSSCYYLLLFRQLRPVHSETVGLLLLPQANQPASQPATYACRPNKNRKRTFVVRAAYVPPFLSHTAVLDAHFWDLSFLLGKDCVVYQENSKSLVES